MYIWTISHNNLPPPRIGWRPTDVLVMALMLERLYKHFSYTPAFFVAIGVTGLLFLFVIVTWLWYSGILSANSQEVDITDLLKRERQLESNRKYANRDREARR